MKIKYLILSTILFLVFFANNVNAQKGYFVNIDRRIQIHEKEMIDFLIRNSQLNVLKNSRNLYDYSGEIFVTKCMEMYLINPDIVDPANQKSILLVRFGSTADHANKYWGILNNYSISFFYNTKDADFKKFCTLNKPKTISTISAYIESASEY